jgi:hypothetical protein
MTKPQPADGFAFSRRLPSGSFALTFINLSQGVFK